VVVVYSGLTGDAQKDLVLTQARAAVIRAYLVANFGFDDTQLKILGMGKKIDAPADSASSTQGAAPGSDSAWGEIEIIVFPVGTDIPASQQAGIPSTLHQ
jgi:hypothetical protein